MNLANRRKFALFALPLIILLLIVSQTGLAADDRIFYGLIALFILSQILWFAYLVRRTKSEELARSIDEQFPDD